MNRLNFSQIVNKNLNKSQKVAAINANRIAKTNLTDPQEMTFFKPNEGLSDEFYEKKRYTGEYRRENKNLSYKLDGIVAYVYTQLAERQTAPNRPKQSKITKQNTGNNSKLIPKPKKSERKPSPAKPPIEDKEKSTLDADNIQKLTIPQLKLKSSYVQQQKRKSTVKSPVMDSNNYENYKRMEKAVARQKELEGMLAHHKQLRDHRQSIAQDIFAMRHSLDDVKHRLNNSLRMLENKKTYSECHRLEKSLKCQKCVEKENEFTFPIQNPPKK